MKKFLRNVVVALDNLLEYLDWTVTRALCALGCIVCTVIMSINIDRFGWLCLPMFVLIVIGYNSEVDHYYDNPDNR